MPALDHELRPFGIRVVLVEPAYTRTSFEDNLARPDQLLDTYDSARGFRPTMRHVDVPCAWSLPFGVLDLPSNVMTVWRNYLRR